MVALDCITKAILGIVGIVRKRSETLMIFLQSMNSILLWRKCYVFIFGLCLGNGILLVFCLILYFRIWIGMIYIRRPFIRRQFITFEGSNWQENKAVINVLYLWPFWPSLTKICCHANLSNWLLNTVTLQYNVSKME